MGYDGLSATELARRLGTVQCFCLKKVTSTMDIVHEMAAQGAPGGTLVLADEQTQGRGRMGKRWASPPEAGVWLGYLWRGENQPSTGVISLRVGLSLVESLLGLGVESKLKWPNDVMIDERKVAGILCEARGSAESGDWIAIGVGINMHGPFADELSECAVALDEVITGVARIDVLAEFIPRLATLSADNALDERERSFFEAHDWLVGKELVEPLAGRASGISDDGSLLVDTVSGLKSVFGGSVVQA